MCLTGLQSRGFQVLYVLTEYFIWMHSNRLHWGEKIIQRKKNFKKITLRWFMKYNWDFWKYCSPTQGLTFTERRPRSEFLWLYNKCYTMFCFSTGVSKLIWGKHSYSITKSWFILSSLGFKAQTIPFFKPNPLYITISLQVNYK